MPLLTDRTRIQVILETDRPWAAYALADLDPDLFARATWFAHDDGRPALALLFRAFEIPVMLAFGRAEDIRPLLDEAGAILEPGRPVYFVTRPDILPLIEAHHRVERRSVMSRMLLDRDRLPRRPEDGIIAVSSGDLDELQILYADGIESGEAPEFFTPDMLAQGAYRAVREAGASAGPFTSAAGTHVLAPAFGVAAIGNVYTRRDRRGLGLGRKVTAAVAAHLVELGVGTIVLNVAEDNVAAIRVYEHLGFRPYCRYHEIIATRS